jgi:hypothetical protein
LSHVYSHSIMLISGPMSARIREAPNLNTRGIDAAPQLVPVFLGIHDKNGIIAGQNFHPSRWASPFSTSYPLEDSLLYWIKKRCEGTKTKLDLDRNGNDQCRCAIQ